MYSFSKEKAYNKTATTSPTTRYPPSGPGLLKVPVTSNRGWQLDKKRSFMIHLSRQNSKRTNSIFCFSVFRGILVLAMIKNGI